MINLQQFQAQVEQRPKFTGKQLLMLTPETSLQQLKTQTKKASLKIATSGDFKKDEQNYFKVLDEADGIFFEKLGIMVIKEDRRKQVSMLTESIRSNFIYSEPERFIYALEDSIKEFLKGYKAAVDDIYKRIVTTEPVTTYQKASLDDDAVASWGIHAINVLKSKYTGKGINVSILDTGFNLKHGDFPGRIADSKSFIRGEKVDDQNGHGTHCTGILSGDTNKITGRRYGVAKDASIYIGKVLSNEGTGTDSSILAGIEWALTNNCKVISMSLGAPIDPGESYSNIYNDIANKALENGSIIIAAAGNESNRSARRINPVGHPANCPAIMAVAAIDKKLNVADFSCGGINEDGGQVDIAGPGVDNYSSWKLPDNFNTISGTSMATPYVAGVAALYWEAFPKASASEIWMKITQNAKRLNLSASDIGAGLVQAP